MPDNIREKAYWLKMQRKRLGLTQKELARLSGASLRSIQSYEQGTRSLSGASIEQIQALCRVLGCSEQEILSYPGSQQFAFAESTVGELTELYEKLKQDKEQKHQTDRLYHGLSAAECERQLVQEMALRFYQEHTKTHKEITT